MGVFVWARYPCSDLRGLIMNVRARSGTFRQRGHSQALSSPPAASPRCTCRQCSQNLRQPLECKVVRQAGSALSCTRRRPLHQTSTPRLSGNLLQDSGGTPRHSRLLRPPPRDALAGSARRTCVGGLGFRVQDLLQFFAYHDLFQDLVANPHALQDALAGRTRSTPSPLRGASGRQHTVVHTRSGTPFRIHLVR